jgi:hypothetical protein
MVRRDGLIELGGKFRGGRDVNIAAHEDSTLLHFSLPPDPEPSFARAQPRLDLSLVPRFARP